MFAQVLIHKDIFNPTDSGSPHIEMQKSYRLAITNNIKELVIFIRPICKIFTRLCVIYLRMMYVKKCSYISKNSFLVFSIIRFE